MVCICRVPYSTTVASAVFAIEVLPRSTDSLDPIYRFSHVCSPSELVEFPDYEPEDECYDEVQNIVKVLNYVIEADVDDEIPPTSLVREFIGGNTFYRK